MQTIDPTSVVENVQAALDEFGEWPNFHDAEVIELHISRGDVRPDDNVYVLPKIRATLELCALENPYEVTLHFEDCDSIEMPSFNHQNPIMDLQFALEERGLLNSGEPMTPFIVVSFVPAWGFELSFRCFRVSVLDVKGTTPTTPGI